MSPSDTTASNRTARPHGRPGGSGSGGSDGPNRRTYRHRPRWRRPLLIGVVAVLAVIAIVVGVAASRIHHYNDNIGRVNAFAGTGHPGSSTLDGPQNFLIIGSDTRAGTLPGQENAKRVAETGGQRSDVLILAHINADHSRGYLISIPRDTYVNVPAGGPWSGGRTKINAAFAFGGAPLAVRTVENYTGVRIDHVVVVNFEGFKKMTDALGGVDVRINQAVYDPRSKHHFHAGVNHLNGEQALDYVRQRYNLPGGDFDREKRQQQFIRALAKKATSTGTLTSPTKLDHFLNAASQALLVDKGLSPSKAVFAFRGIRPGDLSFITTPHLAQTVREPNAGIVVMTDHKPALSLFNAVAHDKVGAWVAAHPQYRNNVQSGD